MKIVHEICIKDPYERRLLSKFFEYKKSLELMKEHFVKLFVECYLTGSNWEVETVKDNLSECIASIDELILKIGDSRHVTYDVIESIKKQVTAKKLSEIKTVVADDASKTTKKKKKEKRR